MVYETVFGTLGKWVSKPFDKLPHELQPIAKAYIPKWQTLTPKERTAKAIEADRQRGVKSKLRYERAVREQNAAPRDQAEDKYWWDLCSLISDKKREITKWEAMPEPLPSETMAKEARLLALRGELAALETQYKDPYVASLMNSKTPMLVVTAGNTPLIPKSKRPDLLTPRIEDAQRGEADPFSAAVIWPKLRTMADELIKPFVGTTTAGIEWEDDNLDVQTLTLKNLRDRLARQKKTR